MTDTDNADDLALPANIPVYTGFMLYCPKQAAGCLYGNARKTELMSFKKE